MEFLIYYAEMGIIANAVAFIVDIILAIILILGIGFFENQKLAAISKQDLNGINLLTIFYYLIPFYRVYLLIIKLYFIKKYYNKTADSIDYIIKKLDKYKIFRRFE